MKTGFFQYLWLIVWNNLIKNSCIYKILCKIYGFFSSKWQTSSVAGYFRGSDEEREKNSGFKWLFGFGFRVADRLSERNEFFTRCNENSFLVAVCKYLLHNFLALNLRFIGILSAAGCFVYALLSMVGGSISCIGLGLGILFAFIAIFNVNMTDYLKASGISRLLEHLIGTEFTYKVYYMTKCSKSRTRYVCAVFFGIAGGALSAAINPIIGVGAVLGIVFFSMVMYKTEFGVFMTVILAPFIPTMALAGMVILSAFSLLVKALNSKKFKWNFGTVGLLILIMIGAYFIGVINSFVRGKSLQIWAVYAVFMIFFFVVINTIRTKKQLFDLCRAFVISGLFACLYGLYQYVSGAAGAKAWLDEEMFEGISTRIYSTFENPNVFGEYILFIMPMTVALMWTAEKKWSKVFYLALAAVMGASLILTFSRGCWIALIIAAAIYITFVCGKLWGLVLLALPIVPFVIPQTILQRFTSVGNMSDGSTSYRVYIWMGSFYLLKDFYLSGIGMGEETFNEVYPFYSYNAVVAPHSHNLFMQIWIETGLGGILTFLAVLVSWLRKLCRGHRMTDDKKLKTMIVAIGAAGCGFLVQGMFDNCFYNYRVFAIFWIVLAIGISAFIVAKDDALAKQNGGDGADD